MIERQRWNNFWNTMNALFVRCLVKLSLNVFYARLEDANHALKILVEQNIKKILNTKLKAFTNVHNVLM